MLDSTKMCFVAICLIIVSCVLFILSDNRVNKTGFEFNNSNLGNYMSRMENHEVVCYLYNDGRSIGLSCLKKDSK